MYLVCIYLYVMCDVMCVGEKELMRRMVRPHLQPGDAVLFDCRTLHFGLANTTDTTSTNTINTIDTINTINTPSYSSSSLLDSDISSISISKSSDINDSNSSDSDSNNKSSGESSSSGMVRRTLIYVNYHQVVYVSE
jgi:hypothetical protein